MEEFDNVAFNPAIEDGDDAFEGTNLQEELTIGAVDDFYSKVSDRDGLTPLIRDYKRFKLLPNGALALVRGDGREVQVTNVNNSEPLKPSTLAGRLGVGAMRDELGFVDYRSSLSSHKEKAVSALQKASDELGATASNVESVEMQDLSAVANRAESVVKSLTDDGLDEILGTMDDTPLNLRELRGLDKALQNIRGELTNNLAKLTELDSNITLEKSKLEQAEDEFSRRRIAERLRDLQEERLSRVEAASATRQVLRSQINRIRETINTILHENTTLAERLRTLFREQGVTIASLITAVGFIISTLVFAVTGGGGTAPAPASTPSPSDRPGVREWAKKHLKALAKILAKLANKAAASLPGVIASVVSWLLNFLAKTAGWFAEHLWALGAALGGLLLLLAQDYLLLAK